MVKLGKALISCLDRPPGAWDQHRGWGGAACRLQDVKVGTEFRKKNKRLRPEHTQPSQPCPALLLLRLPVGALGTLCSSCELNPRSLLHTRPLDHSAASHAASLLPTTHALPFPPSPLTRAAPSSSSTHTACHTPAFYIPRNETHQR